MSTTIIDKTMIVSHAAPFGAVISKLNYCEIITKTKYFNIKTTFYLS